MSNPIDRNIPYQMPVTVAATPHGYGSAVVPEPEPEAVVDLLAALEATIADAKAVRLRHAAKAADAGTE